MNTEKKSRTWLLLVVAVLLIAAIATVLIWQLRDTESQTVSNFEQCRDAGGAIMESYPEQCLVDGQTFINEEQVNGIDDSEDVVTPGDEYVGLEEQEALDRARDNDQAARVVERDGESLPVTMDLSHGRLNFTVEDGVVTSVYVEENNEAE